MFIIILRFSANKDQAGTALAGHKEWIEEGISDGVFLVVGSLEPSGGGAILAHGEAFTELESRVRRDPFVELDVVSAEIVEVAPSRADERLAFLLAS